jgi:UDP-GlcNAc:undecaprenyl-phosphate GlcNAc-1-phosphate transferase
MFAIKDLIREYIFVSVMAFVISVTLTPIIRRLCQQRNVLDFPKSPRKIHATPIPRLGGIAIYVAFFLPLLAMFLTTGNSYELFAQHIGTLISLGITSSLVFAIGIYDDIWGATVLQKLLFQTASAVLMYALGFKITLLSVPFVGSVPLGILGFPLTILWFVGVANALNFIDGIDGLACGVGFFSVSTIFILSLYLHHPITAFFAAALAGGLFGFALYNFNPASIFMGDSGSLFIGFTIAAISLQGSQKSSTAVVLLIPIIALGVPIADTLLAIMRRIGQGVSPFTADKEHIHHRLLNMGFSSRKVTLVLYGVCSFLGITALLMTAVTNQMLTLILIMLSMMTIGGMKMLGYTTDMIAINALAKERIQQRKRLLRQRKFTEEILSEIEVSPDVATLEKTIMRYLENLEFDIGILRHTTGPLRFTWRSPRYVNQTINPLLTTTVTVPLIVHNECYGELLLGKYLDSTTSLVESTLSIEHLKKSIEQSLSRFLSSETV